MINKNLIILCYHGVSNCKRNFGIENFSGKHIFSKVFDDQLKFLKRKKCNFLKLDDVVKNIKEGITFKKNSICITFDDGFKNNFDVAVPILKKLKIPAIFFLCPKNIDMQKMFWVDKIENCINLTKKIKIKIKIRNKQKVFLLNNNKNKIECVNKLKDLCKKEKVEFKNKLINELIKKSGVRPSIRFAKNYQIAKWLQIKKTLKSNLFDIGGHSLEHDIYTKLNKKKIISNVRQTINIIKKKLGYKVRYFSYPEGQTDHYNKFVIEILKRNKITCCPTAIDGKNNHLDNLFHLKRIMVGFNNIKLPKLN